MAECLYNGKIQIYCPGIYDTFLSMNATRFVKFQFLSSQPFQSYFEHLQSIHNIS
jgi:hypothetical protein